MAASVDLPAPVPVSRPRGIPPLPLLTVLNFFNYMDRQVVFGMEDKISATFGLSKFEFGSLGFVNLMVFALASAVSGRIADRIGPRRVIFTGVVVWSLATIGSALSHSFWTLLFCRAVVGVGEGAYGPSANALLCADAPPEKRGRALGIYNIGMAFGATTGLVLGNGLASIMDWHIVFWIAGVPSILLAVSAAFVAAPARLPRPQALAARRYIMAPTFLLALAGGILATFGASALVAWSRSLVITERHLSIALGNAFMVGVGLVCGIGGVVAGGYLGDALTRRARGGHARAIGLSFLVAVPFGVPALLVTHQLTFMVLTAVSVFLFSVYNGPSAAVVDELGPPQYAATLQGVSLFWVHVLGNAPAPPVIGFIADRFSVAFALQGAILAFALSGVLFMIVAHRQKRQLR
jgi:MFS transporter, Spinster family, sphingosine-1-phosphate transporter